MLAGGGWGRDVLKMTEAKFKWQKQIMEMEEEKHTYSIDELPSNALEYSDKYSFTHVSNDCSAGWVLKLGWANDIVTKNTLPISKSSSSVSISACGTAGGGWHFLSWNAEGFMEKKKKNHCNYIRWINRIITKSSPLLLF